MIGVKIPIGSDHLLEGGSDGDSDASFVVRVSGLLSLYSGTCSLISTIISSAALPTALMVRAEKA